MHSRHEDFNWQAAEESVRSSVHALPETQLRVGLLQPTSTLIDEHRAVNRMIDEGRSFVEIEDYVNALPLPSAQLGALWLLAWSEATNPETRSQMIADTIAALRDTEPV
jgi:hypothetical protein